MQQLTWKTSLFGEAYIAEIGTGVFDQHPSKDVFIRYLPKDFNKKHFITIVTGSDSGLLLSYLNELAEALDSYFICVELPEVVEAIKQHGWLDSDRVLLFASDFDLNQLSLSDKFSSYFIRNSVQLAPSLAVIDKHSEYIALWELMKLKFDVASLRFNKSQSIKFIEQHFDNMSELLFPLRKFENLLSGKTAVLLGGGPSVHVSFEWIKKYREKVVVFAANRISSRLLKEGIRPDFFVAVDPQPLLLAYSKDMFEFSQNTILLCSAYVSSNVLNQWAGKVIYADGSTPFEDYFSDEISRDGNLIANGPTVMNFALQSACFMGCTTILLSGVDLCYSSEGQSHESSSIESNIGSYLKIGGARVKTYTGVFANTDPQMAVAKSMFNEQIKIYTKSNPYLRIYQLNSYAACLDDVSLIDINELKSPDGTVTVALKELTRQLNWSAQTAGERLTYLRGEMDLRLTLYRQLIRPVSSVLAQLRVIHKLTPQALQRLSKKVERVKKHFELSLGDERFLLFDYQHLDYAKVLQPLESKESQSIEEIRQILTGFFIAAYRSLLKFISRLEAINQRLDLRDKEIQGCLDESILSQWLALKEPGRGRVWQSRHADKIISQHQLALLRRAEQAFIDQFNGDVVTFKASFESRETRMFSLWKQVESAIQLQDIHRLTPLVEYLLSMADDVEMNQLGHYALMGKYLIENRWLDLIDESSSVNISRLELPKYKMLATSYMALGQLDHALTALEVLCRYSNDFFIVYAELANTMGLIDVAEYAYRLAVETHLDDELTKRKALDWAQQYQRVSFLQWFTNVT
jgi:hypothetical protein